MKYSNIYLEIIFNYFICDRFLKFTVNLKNAHKSTLTVLLITWRFGRRINFDATFLVDCMRRPVGFESPNG